MKTRINNLDQYHSQYQQAQQSPEDYWTKIAEQFRWSKKWSEVQSGSFKEGNIRWFDGGLTNMSENCLDRHLPEHKDKVAVIFEANDPKEAPTRYTFGQLHQEVCKMANLYKDQGVKKGDVICFYMSMVPELLIGILAATRIGAIHSVVFGGFSANALAGRIQDCQAKLVLTNDGGFRGEKIIPLKDIVDSALQNCPSVEKVIVVKRTDSKVSMNAKRDLWFHEEIQKQPTSCAAVQVEAEHPLFILYTSGSTGKPKGLLHTTAGYMVYAGMSFSNIFQMSPEDIFWCTADIGWVTGHTYLTYGPLLNAQTTVMFEGIPTYPDGGRFWDIVDRHQVTHLYTAPTAIRALEALPIELVEKRKLTSLKVLGSVGEPINEEAWEWYHKHIGKGRCPIVDTWWQTETGGIMISSLPNITEQIPSYAATAQPGVIPVLVDANGAEVSGNPAEGNLCLKYPWPGIARTVYGDHKRYMETYFSAYPGMYFTGDGAKRDQRGNYRITGRVDDVINISGHRIGTAEVEEAINEHPGIVESAVVGFPHEIKGQGLYAYVIANSQQNLDESALKKEVNDVITEMIGPIAKVDHLQVVSGLPKTRSGKIMRRILRKVAENQTDQLGDTSTLLNPEIVDELIANKKV